MAARQRLRSRPQAPDSAQGKRSDRASGSVRHSRCRASTAASRAAAMATAASAMCASRPESQRGSARGSSSRQVALAHDLLEWQRRGRHVSGSKAATRRSRKRRRSPARPGEEAVHGRGQPEHAHVFAKAPELFCRRPSISDLAAGRLRRSAAGAGCQPVPIATSSCRSATSAATAQPRGAADGPVRRRRRRAGRGPAISSEMASSRLVLPAPLGPVKTTGRASVSSRKRGIIAEIGQRQAGEANGKPVAASAPSAQRCRGPERCQMAKPRGPAAACGVESLTMEACSVHTRIGIST